MVLYIADLRLLMNRSFVAISLREIICVSLRADLWNSDGTK